jgi:hypothetical protein
VAEEAASLEVDSVPPQVHHPDRAVASDRSRRGRVVQPGIGDGHPLPLPGQQDPQPIHAAQPHLTAPTVESPVRREAHAGFGERPAETDRWQHQHRARTTFQDLILPHSILTQRGLRPVSARCICRRSWPMSCGHTGSATPMPGSCSRGSMADCMGGRTFAAGSGCPLWPGMRRRGGHR